VAAACGQGRRVHRGDASRADILEPSPAGSAPKAWWLLAGKAHAPAGSPATRSEVAVGLGPPHASSALLPLWAVVPGTGGICVCGARVASTRDWLHEPPSRKWRRCGFSLTTSTLLTETVKGDVSKLNCTVPFIGLLSKHTILSMAI
jgi:hypothetical protein